MYCSLSSSNPAPGGDVWKVPPMRPLKVSARALNFSADPSNRRDNAAESMRQSTRHHSLHYFSKLERADESAATVMDRLASSCLR